MRALAAGLALLAFAAPPAAATPTLRTLGPSSSTFTVGTTIVRNPAAGTIELFDATTGARRAVAVERGCVARSGGGAQLLVVCTPPGGEPAFFRLPLRGTALVPVPGVMRREDFLFIGRYWVLGNVGCGDAGKCSGLVVDGPVTAPENVAIDWRTGRRVEGGALQDPDVPEVRPYPTAEPAARLVRRPQDGGPGSVLTLVRRGRPPLRLSRCRTSCTAQALAHGRAAWVDGATAYGYDVASGRLRRWRIPASARMPASGPLLSVVGDRILLTSSLETGPVDLLGTWPPR